MYDDNRRKPPLPRWVEIAMAGVLGFVLLFCLYVGTNPP